MMFFIKKIQLYKQYNMIIRAIPQAMILEIKGILTYSLVTPQEPLLSINGDTFSYKRNATTN